MVYNQQSSGIALDNNSGLNLDSSDMESNVNLREEMINKLNIFLF